MKHLETPTVLILFGATGDLAQKKLLSAIYSLYNKKLTPNNFKLIAFSRREWTTDQYKSFASECLNLSIEKNRKFFEMFEYQQGDFEDIESFKNLGISLDKTDTGWNTCTSKLFYLAVPPQYYKSIFQNLSEAGLTQKCSEEEGWTRIIVEKPFGTDLNSANQLDTYMQNHFSEQQIYRVDHYLGKEMLQNILIFRFYNNLLEKNWSNELIEKINIKVFEATGIKGRANFYDGVGALRDMGESHLLQMLALATMEEPKEFNDVEIRKKRAEILNKLVTLDSDQIQKYTVRGQYNGYLSEIGINPHSKTETYFKVLAQIDDPKWHGVNITLESGKMLNENDKKIEIYLKPRDGMQNKIIFDLEGTDMGIYIEFWAKKPGLELEVEKRMFSFSLCEDKEACDIAQDYEKLLIDCIKGNQTLFVSTNEIKAMWKYVDPIILEWNKNSVPLNIYEQGFDPSKIK